MVAGVSLKLTLAQMLGPIAQLDRSVSAHWRRMWSYARLRNQHPSTDPSVVVLGMPELHGTRRLHLGRDLPLCRDLYFETRGVGEIRIGGGAVVGANAVVTRDVEPGAVVAGAPARPINQGRKA